MYKKKEIFAVQKLFEKLYARNLERLCLDISGQKDKIMLEEAELQIY